MSNKIDWSKAPEGATHNDNSNITPWLHKDSLIDVWSFYLSGKWIKFTDDLGNYPSDIYFKNLVEKPQPKSWNGEGLPPVGTKVQTSIGIMTILFVGERLVVTKDNKGFENSFSKKHALHSFKPLRTNEQKAIDDISKEIQTYKKMGEGVSNLLATDIFNSIKANKVHNVTWSNNNGD